MEMRIRLGARALHQLFAGVVAGLRELERVAQRTHGNVKPSNILLTLGPRAQIRSVVVTDPHGPAGAGLDDRYELGRLICSAVIGAEKDPADMWPIPQSAEWEELGATGDGWRELCNRLIHPNGYYAPNELEKIEGEIAQLKADEPQRRLLIAGIGVAALETVIGLISSCSATCRVAWICQEKNIPIDAISGHNDVAPNQTTCPGKDFYRYLKDGQFKKWVKLTMEGKDPQIDPGPPLPGGPTIIVGQAPPATTQTAR